MPSRCLLLVWAILFCWTGCTPKSEDGSTIKVVSSLPLTGSSRLQTEMMERAIAMAFEEVDYQAGPFHLEYHSWDDATAQAGTWDPAKEKENASRAVADPDVMVYLGTYNSGAAKISIPILGQSGLAMISPGATYTGLTKEGSGEPGEPELYYPNGLRNFCRVVPPDDLQGAAGAAWAKSLGLQTVYILDDKELYGKGVANVFESECRRLGISVVGREGIDGKAPDFRAVTTKIRASGAELVYFGGTIANGATKFVKDLRDSGSVAKFMGPDSLKDTAFLNAVGSAGEGVLCTLGSLPPEEMTPSGKAWYKAYRERYGIEPEAFAVYGYEAAKVAIAGILKAKVKDRGAIRSAIMSTTDHQGALGVWSFDPNGDTSLSEMSGFVVRGGSFVFVKKLRVEPGEVRPLSPGSAVSQPDRPQLGQQLLTGISNGALIAMIALGYTLVYGIVEMVNFAHGEVFMFGSFVAATLIGAMGLSASSPPLWLGVGLTVVLLLTMLVTGLLNAGIDRLALRPLRKSPKQASMITAMGCSFLLLNLAGYWKGWAPLNFPALLPRTNLFGAESWLLFTPSQAVVVLVTAPLLVALHAFVYRSKLGKAMRAVAQNPQASALMGIHADRTIRLAFFLGGALAGAAGLLYGLYNNEVFFLVGFRQGLNAFTAAVLGGIGDLRGAVVGGLVIGIVEALTAYYLGHALAPAVVFGVLILVICVRPRGLFGPSFGEKV